MSFARSAKAFPSESQIESQAGSDLPVILSERGVIVSSVVTVGVGLVGSGNPRVNGRFLKVRVIAREIRVAAAHIGDSPVRLESTITRRLNHCTNGARGVHQRSRADRG